MLANMRSLLNETEELPGVAVTEPASESSNDAWFCVRTHPKHEHIAAAQLRKESGVEVFLPRVRYQRTTRFGAAWTTEAMFRDYRTFDSYIKLFSLVAGTDPAICPEYYLQPLPWRRPRT